MTNNKTDSELIYDSLEGDDDAFRELLHRHLKHVFNFIYQLTGNSEESKDLTQETFIKVWKNLKKYKKEFSFKTWVLKIAKNTAIDYLRKKKPLLFSDFNKDDDLNSFEDTLIDQEPLADELFETAENKEIIEKSLSKISIQKRSILILHINEHLTFEEISEILKKPMNTVKSQYRRALIQLKEYLKIAPK